MRFWVHVLADRPDHPRPPDQKLASQSKRRRINFNALASFKARYRGIQLCLIRRTRAQIIGRVHPVIFTLRNHDHRLMPLARDEQRHTIINRAIHPMGEVFAKVCSGDMYHNLYVLTYMFGKYNLIYPRKSGGVAPIFSIAIASSRLIICWPSEPSVRIATLRCSASRPPTTSKCGTLARLCSRTL